MMIPLLKDTAARNEKEFHMARIILSQNFGKLCDFFGPKMAMEEIMA